MAIVDDVALYRRLLAGVAIALVARVAIAPVDEIECIVGAGGPLVARITDVAGHVRVRRTAAFGAGSAKSRQTLALVPLADGIVKALGVCIAVLGRVALVDWVAGFSVTFVTFVAATDISSNK